MVTRTTTSRRGPQGDAIVFERDAPDFGSSGIYILGHGGNLAGQPMLIPGSMRAIALSKTKVPARNVKRPPKQIEGGGALPRWGAASSN
jgi:hypothetical protein